MRTTPPTTTISMAITNMMKYLYLPKQSTPPLKKLVIKSILNYITFQTFNKNFYAYLIPFMRSFFFK
ncbi:hypothetical protein EAF07_08295 [Streptococcus hillyeri]|uniref:Uncharacterized protein n=1 Tax=Streptococcus hillyeri TaxID=2282420 RepID=A0A3L9DPK7_9STRE|nr:hypothetical protein EAF07_08295 [Streptococcus hillyeri]